MPSLSHDSALGFWKEFMNGSVFPIIQFIEGSEDWVNTDDPEIITSLERLSEFLGTASDKTNLSEIDFVKVCAPLHLSQKLRICGSCGRSGQ